MKVKIFTEAGQKIGYGHFTRCLSLYDAAVLKGIEVELYVYDEGFDPDMVEDRNISIENWLDEAVLSNLLSTNDMIIVDSYLASKKHYETFSKLTRKVLFLDDTNRIDYPSGIIVNPSFVGSMLDYPEKKKNSFYTGPEFIILREPFIKNRGLGISEYISRVLIIMGGTDIKGLTKPIVNSLTVMYPDLVFDVVVPGDAYDSIIKDFPNSNIHIHTKISAEKMSVLMENVDVAITAAGQTIYELIALKVPFLAVQVIDNQKYNVKAVKKYISDQITLNSADELFMEQLGHAFNKLQEYEMRKDLVARMNHLIDGLGSKRIIDTLLAHSIKLRKAQLEDKEDVFHLSNEDYVRKYSINKNKIEWASHLEWFEKVISDPDISFYIVTNELGQFLGQVRFNIADQEATISISLHERIKGKGLSKQVLASAVEKLLHERLNVDVVVAYIAEVNIASLKLFTNYGFSKVGKENGLLKLILERGSKC